MVVELYDNDGVTLLAVDDDGGGGRASLLDWNAPGDATYFVRIKQAAGSSSGCDSYYQLVIEQEYTYTFLPSIYRP